MDEADNNAWHGGGKAGALRMARFVYCDGAGDGKTRVRGTGAPLTSASVSHLNTLTTTYHVRNADDEEGVPRVCSVLLRSESKIVGAAALAGSPPLHVRFVARLMTLMTTCAVQY